MAERFSPSSVQIVGILNVTPDSFYDGGTHLGLKQAIHHAETLIREGADWIDIGGESTRPGSSGVSAEEELKRVLPLIRALTKKFPKIPLSIDTRKSAVAEAALDSGAQMVNDVSSLTHDPGMIEVVLKHRPFVTLMHMKGNPSTMQSLAKYKNAVNEIKSYLASRARMLIKKGFPKNKIIVDPGIGFGKTLTHNLEILYNVRKFAQAGFPVMIGASRKSFIGRILGNEKNPLDPKDRLEGSLACALWAAEQGAGYLRVHDVGATRRALKIFGAIKSKGD